MAHTVTNILRLNYTIRYILSILFLSLGAHAAWGEATKSVWDGTVPSTANVSKAECNKIGITGSGTEAEPYVISTAGQLAYFASKMNGNTNWWRLADNVELDLDGEHHAWTYGQSNANFKGHFDGNKSSGSLISNMKFETNGANKSLGLFPQIQGSSATNHTEVKNLEIKNFQITTPGSGTSYGATTNVGLLIGKINGNADVVNVTITGTNSISYDVTTTGANYVGALAGNVTSDNCTVKNCTISGVTITTNTAVKKDFYLGGLAGNTSNNAVILGNTVLSISITLNGNTNGNNIIGGLIGKVAGTNSTAAAGLPMGKRSLVQKNTVTSPSITMNGSVEVANLELGGMIGWVGNHTNVFNNKVTSPNISLTNNINNHSYIGGAVGYQDGYTFVDGLTVSGTGSITGPASDKIVKNNVNLFVGGYLGYMINSGVNAFQAGKFKNIAVTGMNINLGNYKPGGAIQNHKFSVGGIAGSINSPNMTADGTWGGMPENLIFKGGKIYAPWASTSPTVSNFNAGAAAHDNMTLDKVNTVDAIEKAKVNTWYYNDYKLGLSSEFLNSTSVKAHDANPAQFEFRKNYSASPTEEDGIQYLSIDNSTFAKSNRYQDSERDSKTVLWWTQQASMDKSKGTVAAVTCFTANEQPIYPQSGATSAQAGNLTQYPYYMYFFQGVSNAKYASNADAGKIVEGIEANFTNNVLPAVALVSGASDKTVTITNDGETRRGFDTRTLTVTVKNGDNDVSSNCTYQWYVDGQSSSSSSSLSLTPHWKNGQGITVNVLNGGTIIATASYGFAPGILKTKDNDPIRTDISSRGTSSNPYIIDCENALRQLSYLSTAHTNTYWETVGKPVSPYPTNQTQGHYNRAYYELGADIDLGSTDFIPISHVGYGADGSWGTYTTNFIFQGVFDGKGHTISNYNITWGASQYVGNNANLYYGLFGAVGNAAAARKWGDAENGNTVIKNLIISGATLTHNTAESSFYYDQNISTNANYALVGVLVGVVTSNTTIQNIEIRNSAITDTGSGDYSLATKGLYVGGAIGAVQAAYNATTNVPANTQIQHIAAKVDITLTKPTIVKTSDATQTGSFNVGGIIGRYVATGATKEQVEPTLPAYTIYSGTVNAPKAWISPVVASLRYKDQNSFNFNNYSRHWEGNNNSAATQVAINNALYYDFTIGTNKITDTYPANTCALGSRTMTAHSNGSDAALTYSAAKYQGVNYGARYVDVEGASLELLNGAPFDDYNWVWSDGFPHMSTAPYIEARISRVGDTFTATLVGAEATSYKWQAKFDDVSGWKDISTADAATYAVPKSLKPKYIVAFVNGTYRTLVELVEPNKNLINPEVKHSDSKYKLDLGNGDNNIDHLTVTYEWFNNTKTTQFTPPVTDEDLDDSKVPTGNIVWCKVIVTELGVEVYNDYLLSGATMVYVKSTGTNNVGDSRERGWTPETPVKTLDHANSLLKTIAEGGNVDNNVIVVMDELPDLLQSSGRNPATITGKGYNAVLNVQQKNVGDSEHNLNTANRDGQKGANCYVLADTKFEHLTFKGNQGGNTFIECHGHDVTFGKGLVMTNFAKLSQNHGNVNNALEIPEFTIILTATNLPKEDIDEYTNRTKPQVVTFQSGHYGRLMGGRFTQNFFAKNENTAHSILGSAAKPVWAVVNIELDNDNEMTDGRNGTGTKTYTADINAIIAGLTDGTMYGDYTINFYGGNVAYIVGGNQGNAINNGSATYTPVGGTSGEWGQWPNASYFGRTVINIEDKSAENSSIKPITVGNLYAGGLGRKVQSGSDAKAAVDMYMYGRTEVNVKSGTISGSVYGGGVGGVIGVNPWDAHVPYITTSDDNATTAIQDKVQYGDNRVTGYWSNVDPATATMAKVTLHNLNDAGTDYVAEELDLTHSSTTVNVIGGAVNGNVYGGGWGEVDDMPIESAVQGIGSVFGTTNINVTGGTITGNVYGGSQGSTKYYDQKNTYGQTITHIAEMNGTVNLNVSGTEELYPTIGGNIFGAGKGVETVADKEFADIARTGNTIDGTDYKSTINITVDLPDSHPFTGNIYGGGQMGKVDGEINVNIKNGVINGNIFGAGLGEAGHTDTKAMVTGNTYVNMLNAKVYASATAGTGNVFGGGQLGKVIGNTNVTMEDGIIENNVYGGGDQGIVTAMANVNIDGGELRGNVFGGGNKAVVGSAYTSGNIAEWASANGTTVTLNSKDAYVYGDIFGGGNEANVEGNASVTLYAGNFAGNIFGGGNGLLDASGNVTTSADVTGNTSIYIAQDEGGQSQATKKDNFNINVIWDKKWNHSSQSFLTWTEINQNQFYADGKFLDNHNIYGGGNNACIVGTYSNEGALTAGTGNATVTVLKGMTPVGLLRTTEWKNSYNDNNNPHFYVFGGGFGKNTKVGSTDVTVNVDGEYGDYTAEVDNPDEQLSKPFTPDFTDDGVTAIFDNKYGIPNFTVLGALGGGYAGTVSGNTKVTIDGKTFLHRVYGGGFGDPNADSSDDITGQVGGSTDVHINGANIYGDVFGGGAGVVAAKNAGYNLDNVARVLGKTSVTVADDANIYGKVYGGGDMACVGVAVADDTHPKTSGNYTTMPSSASTKKTSGVWEYHVSRDTYQSFVNILGGNIFGEVYGGGKGVKKAGANDYTKVGRIEGNTLVHIACSQPTDDGQDWVVVPEATPDAIVPYVWNRIYGGCAYGTVDGNTMVHVEGGMLGLNIFGGGYGDMTITDDETDSSSGASTASSTLNQVLGKLDPDATFANILGNTRVQIDGGSWIWNRKADTNGNITTWLDANRAVTDGLEGFKLLVAQILQAKTEEDLRKIDAVKSIDPNFFNLSTRQFFKNHNIFGGGNRACFVGTYPATDTDASASGPDALPAANTGTSEVIINHSPITKIADANGNEINMLDPSTVAGLCWYLGINNIEHPQFSVFGAGYGANTKVGNTIVMAQPGIQLKVDGTLLNPTSPKYLNEESDLIAWFGFDQEIAESWEHVSIDDRKRYYGLADENSTSKNVFLRYRASQLAWSLGSPNFTFMDVHGGGFSGYVVGNTSVTTDCQLNARNIFGAGLGSKPYGTIADQAAANAFTLGQVGGNSNVFIKSGVVSLNVYGGGAGIESIDKNADGSIDTDFPNIALVKGKTQVDVYGESIEVGTDPLIPADMQNKRIERTMIFGSVYGGGDVANVGTSSKSEAVLTASSTDFTTTVNIRGGSIQAQVYAGGNGRLADMCSINNTDPANPVYGYKNLGAVYGNTRLIVDSADDTYPYESSSKTPNAIASPHIWNRVYGGCENGTVYGNTLVEIKNGSLGHNIFGGGFGDDGTGFGHSTGDEDYALLLASSPQGRNSALITSADVTGNTNIFVTGGEMELTSYWRPETRTWEPAAINSQGQMYSPQYDPSLRKFKINHNVFGGGNAACTVGGNTYITMTKGMLKQNTQTLAGVAQDNFFASNEWHEVYDKVGSPHFAIFGGGYGEKTDITGNTILDIRMTADRLTTPYVPGSGHLYFATEASVMDIVGGGYSGKVTGNTNVTVNGNTYARRVFGGGFYNSVSTTNVNVNAVDCDDVFGGGLMGDVINSTNVTVGSTSTTDDNTAIRIHGSVFGGNDVSGYINMSLNDDGFFKENSTTGGTNITINGGNIEGNVYGAGNGDYLYALDREGHDKVTVNEHYPLDPNDANSQKFDLVYTVPMRETMPSYKAASDAAKIVNINSWRPLTNRVNINIAGSDGDAVTIKGDVYGGGNSATVQKVYNSDNTAMTGDVSFNIGSYVNIGRVFMGCNGDALFTASEDNAFLSDFQKLNNLQLDDPIDWANDPSNHGISTLYLPTENEQRPIIYPHLLDLYFQPVEMNIQATLKWNGVADGTDLTNCTIGTFCCGGNRGNMNVYPMTESDYATGYTGTKKIGNVLDYLFPAGLTITDKIIGGCNNANYEWYNSEKNTKIYHEGGYLLGEGHTTYPFIKLTIKNQFDPTVVNGAYKGGNVYGGCFETGTVRGDVTVDMQTDMLSGKTKATLDKSNELLATDPSYAALNVYGAGYGMESYVYGNTNILFGQGVACTAPTETDGKFDPNGPVVADKKTTGTSANFVYGGGQQGNVIGVTNVDVLNGHIYKSVTGGSYSGYVYGSTQIKVGYPKTYTLNPGKAGAYHLKRTDVNNLSVMNKDANNSTAPTIKQYINLIPGDVITSAVYDAIDGKYESVGAAPTTLDDSGKAGCFTESAALTPSVGWDNINIYIDEACYGGGYSLAQGSSVMANNTTVLKYTDQFNINNTYKSGALAELVGFGKVGSSVGTFKGTTAGFGGNTMMLIGDAVSQQTSAADRDHITISKQVMQMANVPNGTDLYGYYYLGTDDKYHYIYQAGTYYKGTNMPQGASGNAVYQFDAEGGIFGDGHLSYAEGFRAADVTGYGYASHTVDNPKKINTFQRMDLLRLTDNCFTLLGARDYTVNEVSTTPYSIARVGEIQMISSIASDGALGASSAKRSRNFLGFSNNIHYVGAVYSNVAFSDTWHNASGALGGDDDEFVDRTAATKELAGLSYQAVKQAYIDDYYNPAEDIAPKNDATFQRRNDGTAKNMIGIASGYALKIQNVQESYETNASGVKKMKEDLYYGPIYGVVEVNLIDVREDEGGGYVYADNIHKRTADDGSDEDFLETTGNFVFPYSAQDGRHVVDDCFPTGYDVHVDGKSTPEEKADVHYWYVTGYNYFYNAHITGYTYDSHEQEIHFDMSNTDGLMKLSGAKAGQTPRIYSITWRSGHTGNDYTCAMESGDLNPKQDTQPATGGIYYQNYNLGISAAQEGIYSDQNSAYYHLPFYSQAHGDTEILMAGSIPNTLGTDANIGIRLWDKVDNSASSYFNSHLKQPCEATIILTLDAYSGKYDPNHPENNRQNGYIGISYFYEQQGTGDAVTYVQTSDNSITIPSEHGPGSKQYYYYNSVLNRYTPITDLTEMYTKNGSDYTKMESGSTMTIGGSTTYYYKTNREYTYTIYLTIDYVQGPSINGGITVENCALPGEMVRVNKKNVRIESDESFAADGYYWRIGKREKGSDGKWDFVDKTPWTKANATANTAAGYDSYMQTEQTGTGKGFFQGANYNKTNDYLDIPAYYYMNGYGIQLGVSMTGLDQIFPVPMQDTDQFVVHNYHRMMPHGATNVNLHLAQAVARAKAEKDKHGGLAQPRIYLSDTQDLAAFVAFLDSVGTGKQIINGVVTPTGIVVGDKEYVKLCARQATAADVTAEIATSEGQWIPNLCEVPRYGEYAQFTVQNDMEIPAGYDVSNYGRDIILKGTVHGEGHVVTGLGTDKALITENRGHIHNLGMASGKMAAQGCKDGGQYHCCFEYNDGTNEKKVYRMDGECVTTYTADDFRYGRVAYDLNQYYLEARKILAGGDDGCGAASNLKAALGSDGTPAATKAALKYVFDYWANGDYQYARRSDDKTSEVTGITYLRTGTGTDDPNYGSNLTRHDMRHTIDKPRAQEYVAAHDGVPESRSGDYLPLFNAAYQTESLSSGNPSPELMNDYIYWGQSLQQIPDAYPGTIQSKQLSAMTNRVYRAAGYYHTTSLGGYHYNAYNRSNKSMGTYVHDPLITAIDFTCQADGETQEYIPGLKDDYTAGGRGTAEGGSIYYPPVADNASTFASFAVENGVTHNLLVYTSDNDEGSINDSYDVVRGALNYGLSTPESDIKGHHVVIDASTPSTKFLHLVERADASAPNNDFCAPLAFDVTDRAWYTRQPLYYAQSTNDAWEGICLPFTVGRVGASLNGEITHFYGTPTPAEVEDPNTNYHTLHHEYWLRGLTSVAAGGSTTAYFSRPGTEAGLFAPKDGDAPLMSSVVYTFDNPFFKDTYGSSQYYNDDNGLDASWYMTQHTYPDYLPLTHNIPYLVSFPGSGFYEFDLSSDFYNSKVGGERVPEQYITYSADATAMTVTIPVSIIATTIVDDYSHVGTFVMREAGYLHDNAPAPGTAYTLNDEGIAFDQAGLSDVMPFRTYMLHTPVTSKPSGTRGTDHTRGTADVILIGQADGESLDGDHGDPSQGIQEEGLRIYPRGRSIIVESTYATTLTVHTAGGQVVRLLDVIPGTNTYTGFPSGIYLIAHKKLYLH